MEKVFNNALNLIPFKASSWKYAEGVTSKCAVCTICETPVHTKAKWFLYLAQSDKLFHIRKYSQFIRDENNNNTSQDMDGNIRESETNESFSFTT